jgi:hypothetical protein
MFKLTIFSKQTELKHRAETLIKDKVLPAFSKLRDFLVNVSSLQTYFLLLYAEEYSYCDHFKPVSDSG